MTAAPRVLVAALSARALVRMTKLTGAHVIAADCFGDQDTRRDAAHFESIAHDADAKTDGFPGIDSARLLAVVERLLKNGGLHAIVPGSGFEGRHDLLDALAARTHLAGSPPTAWRRCEDPDRFFPTLHALRIPCPPTRTQTAHYGAARTSTTTWLRKAIHGTGALHIDWSQERSRHADSAPLPESWHADSAHYLQARCAGLPMSLSCLVTAGRTDVLSVNRQLFVRWPPVVGHSSCGQQRRRIFAGVISGIELEVPWRNELFSSARRLLPELGIRGLCSIDFIAQRKGFDILEVNPRFGASSELILDFEAGGYVTGSESCAESCADADAETQADAGTDPVAAGQWRFARRCIAAHLDLPRRDSRRSLEPTATSRGLLTRFADRAMRWPTLVPASIRAIITDIPAAGAPIVAGTPICTVHASGMTPSRTRAQLAFHATLVDDWLRVNA